MTVNTTEEEFEMAVYDFEIVREGHRTSPDEQPFFSTMDWDILHQVNLCRQWIKDNSARGTSQKCGGSYGFKRVVEDHSGIYIYNSSFIVAAVLEGLDIQFFNTDCCKSSLRNPIIHLNAPRT